MTTFPLPGANWSYLRTLTLKASTGLAGVTLVNGTPTILSWTAPNDGKLHRVCAFAACVVASPETGGAVFFSGTAPDGTGFGWTLVGGGQGAGFNFGQNANLALIRPGSTITVNQAALTAGAATLWAEIWGS